MFGFGAKARHAREIRRRTERIINAIEKYNHAGKAEISRNTYNKIASIEVIFEINPTLAGSTFKSSVQKATNDRESLVGDADLWGKINGKDAFAHSEWAAVTLFETYLFCVSGKLDEDISKEVLNTLMGWVRGNLGRTECELIKKNQMQRLNQNPN